MPGKRFRAPWLRKLNRGRGKRNPFWISLAFGLAMTLFLIRWFDAAIRPQLVALSESQISNRLIQIADQAVTQAIVDQKLSYPDMVTLRSSGELFTLVTDTASLNSLRTAVLDAIIAQIGTIDNDPMGVPLGALTGIDLLSALGPRLPVQVISVSTAEGQYRNDFTSAGINQTLHRIMLDVTLNARLLLPGGVVEVLVSTPVCISETVIIGQVPQTYLTLNQ